MYTNIGAASAEMTLALIDKIGRKNTEWLLEWESELFEYPCEGWKIEEFVHMFEDEKELLDFYDAESLETLQEEVLIFEDTGLTHIIVFE